MSRLTVGSLEGLSENSNVISVPTGHTLNVADAGALQIGGSGVVSAGLVHISRTTIGSAVSSATVSGAFSTDYDNYRIVVSGGAGSTHQNIRMYLGSTNTGYYGVLFYATYAGATGTYADSNTNFFSYVGNGGTNGLSADVFVYQPFATAATGVSATTPRLLTTGQTSMYTGMQNSSTSYTDFTILVNTGTMTGGTIDVYGYAKA